MLEKGFASIINDHVLVLHKYNYGNKYVACPCDSQLYYLPDGGLSAGPAAGLKIQ